MNILITGGAGFIGSNIASYFIKNGENVCIIDNLSRKHSNINLKWLRSIGNFSFIDGDVCRYYAYEQALKTMPTMDIIFHFAGQTAVTKSIMHPIDDFNTNVVGTLNLLEIVRRLNINAVMFFTSTNKVYGEMPGFGATSELCPLDFCSPYGCSKGSAEQYFIDYHRTYGLNTIVFRMSCIYGYRQLGTEDQGWVMHFVKSALKDETVTIYGDGKQVRDILYIDDLVDAFLKAWEYRDETIGNVYNIGGGSKNTISLIDLIKLLECKLSKKISIAYDDSRLGDQQVYISDIQKALADFKWHSTTPVNDGIDKLIEWCRMV